MQKELERRIEERKERDSRRRRIKYKSKSVHTNGKTATEVIREVINGQMEAYEDWLKQELSIETSTSSSPVSSNKNSYGEEIKNGSQSHRYRSLSKDSERSRYIESSKEKRYNKERYEGKYEDRYENRYRKHEMNHRSRSNSQSRRYEKERRYKYEKYEKYEHRRDRRSGDRYEKSSKNHHSTYKKERE